MLGLEQRLHQYEPLFGSWHLCGEIGSGNFGRVYRVEYRDLFGTVFSSALKVIEIVPDKTLADTPEQLRTVVRKAYESEIGTLTLLRGVGNVVHMDDHAVMEIYEDGKLIGYDLLIRMELLESLGDLLRREDPKLQKMEEVRRLGIDLCRALVRCHSRNILHRDINPKNIFRNRFGDYKLGDFGIAKQLEGTVHAGTAIGTKNYAAPEVVAGEEYDARADIYSLGVVLYQLANQGYLPFFYQAFPPSESRKAVSRRLGGEELTPPSQADAAFSRIILKACAFHPADRFASIQDMYHALCDLDRPAAAMQAKPQTALDFWQTKLQEKFDVLGTFGLAVVATPEMRYMAERLVGYPERTKQQPAGVLTPRTAAHLPTWCVRAPWFPFNRLTVRGYSTIGDRAFRGRKDLISVQCSKSVKVIGTEAFLRCTNLGEVTCAPGLEQVRDGAFADCVRLVRCHLPETVRVLGERAFAGCTALNSLRVPDGVQALGDEMCDGCIALHQVTLPSTLRSVGQACFRGSGLKKILLPDSCIRLGEAAFSNCRNLTSVQTSLRMAIIPKDCFFGCTSLAQFDLPFRLTEIRDRAFYGCTSLKQIVIPEGVRRIGMHVFAQCDNLSVIRVPNSVQHIGEEAFGVGGRLRGRFGKLTVVANRNSYAWQYCKQCGIRVREP